MNSPSSNVENIPVDSVSRSYIRLAFHINRLAPGYIDAYFGPPEWQAEAEAEGEIPPHDLRQQAQAVLHDLPSVPQENRREWLSKQLTAMMATLRRLEGESLPFEEELQLVYDITPHWTNEHEFEDALCMMSDLLPGSQPLPERLEAWNEQFRLSPETILPLALCCRDEIRRRTRQVCDLPETEQVSLHLVENKPWAAYNWYQGDYHSRIEINTDLPMRANQLPFLLTHEAYAGHHTEHVVKERRLYRQLGYAETCVQLLNAPECVISEGIAELAWQIIFSEHELKTWLREELYPRAGLDPSLVVRDRAIAHAQRKLKPVDGNAAFMVHRDGATEQDVVAYIQRYSAITEQRARRSYRFIADPLLRGYVFSYHYGRDLLDRYLDAGDPLVRFQTLLEQPLTPSRVEQWVGVV
ncbi:MAG: hypothetical protein JW850_21040 [Thermoflexales bacterium]|nr:hypothetical protein [Thermoflexales bacterium]